MAGLVYTTLIIILFDILLFETVSIQFLYSDNSLKININFVFLAINLTPGGKNKKKIKEKRAKKRPLPVKEIIDSLGALFKKSSLTVNKFKIKTRRDDYFDAAGDFGKMAFILSLVLPILKNGVYKLDIKKDAIVLGEENEVDVEIQTLLCLLLFSLIKIAFAFLRTRFKNRRKVRVGN